MTADDYILSRLPWKSPAPLPLVVASGPSAAVAFRPTLRRVKPCPANSSSFRYMDRQWGPFLFFLAATFYPWSLLQYNQWHGGRPSAPFSDNDASGFLLGTLPPARGVARSRSLY